MARQRPTELKRCSVNELILAALDMVGERLRAAGVEVRLDLEPDLQDVDADEDQIIQVFTNLIVNAEHALRDIDGTRQLTIISLYRPQTDMVVVKIKDDESIRDGVADEAELEL